MEAMARLAAQIRPPSIFVILQPSLLTRIPETGPVKNTRAIEREPTQATKKNEIKCVNVTLA